jgi:hypothetical protein
MPPVMFSLAFPDATDGSSLMSGAATKTLDAAILTTDICSDALSRRWRS